MKILDYLKIFMFIVIGTLGFVSCSDDDDKKSEEPDTPEVPDAPKLETFNVNVKGVTFKMIAVKGGTFKMGTDEVIKWGSYPNDDERPVHKVTLSDYYIGETEVPQKLWLAVMGTNPSSFKGDDRPVENVSYDDCLLFISKLNSLTGKSFRLPTEAEWEYAARGGSKSKGYKYSGTSYDRGFWDYSSTYISDPENPYLTHVGEHQNVGHSVENELGIYDMSGNVGEWCSDYYATYPSSDQVDPTGPSSGYLRVYRGGSFEYDEYYCRCTTRFYSNLSYNPNYKFNNLGMRLAMPLK